MTRIATVLVIVVALLAPSAAIAQGQTLRAIADGSAADLDFNQEGDFVVDGLASVLVGFNTVFGTGEYRGVYEFDLHAASSCTDVEATLRLNLLGTHLGDTSPDLTLSVGDGDGSLDPADFESGQFVAAFSAFDANPFNILDVSADVQALVDAHASFISFVVRPNPSASAVRGAFLYSSNEVSDTFGAEPSVLTLDCRSAQVSVDVRPGAEPNPVNLKSNGVTPVAILTTATFDASTVDVSTVRFGASGTEASPVRAALADVDRDRDRDLVLHFTSAQLGLTCGDAVAVLNGSTTAGQTLTGSDAIKTVGCK